jgi:hypothetical protein
MTLTSNTDALDFAGALMRDEVDTRQFREPHVATFELTPYCYHKRATSVIRASS